MAHSTGQARTRPSRPAAPPPAPQPASPPASQPAPRQRVVAPPVPKAPAILIDPSGARVPLTALLPLRLFLGVTFFYAGVQKLTDPNFFRPHAPTYIGTQIAVFAHNSPIGGFLTTFALPHAVLFGAIVAWGEIAIGLGTLSGTLFRPAAFFGSLLSCMLWLSATWQIKPYFYGADIFSLFGWLTLTLAGTQGVLALDPLIGAWLAPRLRSLIEPARAARVLTVLGLTQPTPFAPIAAPPQVSRAATRHGVRTTSRRGFLQGATTGAIAAIIGAFFWNALHSSPSASPPATPSGTTGGTTTGGTPATTGATSSSAVANLSSLAPNSSASFTIPSNQDPGVVVRLASGSVVAFDATCTHAGCPVQYDPGSQLLICPCHGAEFDPAHNANVVQGPAPTPLTAVAVSVNKQTGDITLS